MYNKHSRKIMQKYLVLLLLIKTLYASAYDNKLELGVKTSFYNYTERNDEDQILDTEKSSILDMGGVYASYDHKLKEITTSKEHVAHYINVYTSIAYGETEYKGSTLGSAQGYGSLISRTAHAFYEIQGNLKRVQFYENGSRYIAFGFGREVWERALSSNQIETYTYDFAQIAVGGDVRFYQNLSIGIDLTGQIGFNPKMKASINSDSGVLNETYSLGSVYSYKVAAPLIIPIGKQVNFKTKLEYEFTSFSESNIIVTPSFTPCSTTGCFQPKSQQKNWNLSAGFEFEF